MTLTISISPEVEAKLKQEAAAAGKDLATYASELLESAAAVYSGEPANSESNRSIYDELLPILEQAWALPLNPEESSRVHLKGEEAIVEQMIIEKFRKQGLKL
jgi:hypothetical protein